MRVGVLDAGLIEERLATGWDTSVEGLLRAFPGVLELSQMPTPGLD